MSSQLVISVTHARILGRISRVFMSVKVMKSRKFSHQIEEYFVSHFESVFLRLLWMHNSYVGSTIFPPHLHPSWEIESPWKFIYICLVGYNVWLRKTRNLPRKIARFTNFHFIADYHGKKFHLVDYEYNWKKYS